MDKATFEEYIQAFEARLEAKGPNREENLLPVNAGHDKSGPAYAWIDNLSIEDDGKALVGHIKEWTSLGKKALKGNLYRYISAEISDTWSDFQTGEEEKNVLTGAALTNIPYMQLLMPVKLTLDNKFSKSHDNKQSMKLSVVKAKDVKDLSQEEIDFLKEKAHKLSEDEKKKFASVLETKKEEKKELSKDVVTLEKKELDAMKATLEKYEREEKKREVEKFVDGMILNEANKEGKLLKKQRDAAIALASTFSDEQRAEFEKFVNELPTPNIFEEKGEGGGDNNADFQKKLDLAVEAYKAKHKNVSTRAAIKAVFDKNPSLREEYEKDGIDKA